MRCYEADAPLPRRDRPTFRRIIARRDTECFDGTPYVLAAVQCAAWVLYCAITPGRMAPGVTNGIGVVVEARAARVRVRVRALTRGAARAQSCYCAVFMRYVHPGPRRAAFAKALALACSCFAVGTLFLFLGVPRASRRGAALHANVRPRVRSHATRRARSGAAHARGRLHRGRVEHRCVRRLASRHSVPFARASL